MSDIAPIGSSQPTAINTSTRARQAEAPTSTVRGEDEVQLSDHARLLSKLKGLPDVRQDVVDRVRSEIDGGGYETNERIDATVNALLEDLA